MNKTYVIKCGSTPEHIYELRDNEVFVFGSNLQGHHGGGAAAFAKQRFGAKWGVGVGMQGQAYAIPTMHGGPEAIKPYVNQFIEYAKENPDKHFLVTKIGCGIAGFSPEEIAPLFEECLALSNVSLPTEFIHINAITQPEVIGWDAEMFLKKYRELIKDYSKYYEVKVLRVQEYRNTIELVKQGFYVNSQGAEVSLDYQHAGEAVFYSQEICNNPDQCRKFDDMEVEVVNDDCLAVAVRLKNEGYNPAVLNMASRRNPGGGVTTGAGAQEETLFRRTDLFRSLYRFADYAAQYGIQQAQEQYPLDRNYGGVYTPCALLFREDEKHCYKLMEKPVPLAFVTVAGMNRPDLSAAETIAEHHIEPIKNKIRTILRIGVRHSHDSLVLGALGCGAFRNPPKHVARLFREVLEESEFQGSFRKVVFAILDDHNAHHSHNPEGNYKPFADEFGNFGQKTTPVEISQEMKKLLEDTLNWTLPGCQSFYRDTNTDVEISQAYPVGKVFRAGFFIDVTAKAQKPVTNTRFMIASAHCAQLHLAVSDEDFMRWRLGVLHFNSYFKVLDVYRYQGVTQVFLLHIPYQAVPFFTGQHYFNFIQGASQIDLVDIAHKSLESKMQMEVFADTTEPALLERMEMLPGYDTEGKPLPIDFMTPTPMVESMSGAVRQLADDLNPINYPKNYLSDGKI